MARKARIPAAGSGFARTLWPFPQRSGGAKVVRRSRRRRASISRSAYKKLVRELPNHFVLAYCWGAARLRQPRTPRHEALGKPNRGRSQRQAAAAFHGERTNRCTRRNRILRTTLRHSQARQQAWTRRSASRCSPCCATVKVWKYMIPNPLFNNLFCGSCSSPVPVHNRRDFSRRITQPTFPTSVANLRDILEHTIREAILFQVLDNGVWTSYCQTFHCQAAMAS